MKAPYFSALDQNGNRHTLDDYAGSWIVLYFYPKDDTPGCTKEACAFRDGRDLLKSAGAEIIGISKDTIASHKKFADKHELNFTLLSDPDHVIAEAFGSWKPKKFMGKEFIGITRDTYLINPSGIIVKKYEGVNPLTHFDEVLRDLETLKS